MTRRSFLCIHIHIYYFSIDIEMESSTHCQVTQTLHALYRRRVRPGILGCNWETVDFLNMYINIEIWNIDVDTNIFNHCQMTPSLHFAQSIFNSLLTRVVSWQWFIILLLRLILTYSISSSILKSTITARPGQYTCRSQHFCSSYDSGLNR